MGSCTTVDNVIKMPQPEVERPLKFKAEHNKSNVDSNAMEEKLKRMEEERERKKEELMRMQEENRKKEKERKEKKEEEQKRRQTEIENKLNDLTIREQKIQHRRKKLEEDQANLNKKNAYLIEVEKNQIERGRSLQTKIHNAHEKIKMQYLIGNGIKQMIEKNTQNPEKTSQKTIEGSEKLVNFTARKSNHNNDQTLAGKNSGIYVGKKKPPSCPSQDSDGNTGGIKKNARRTIKEVNPNENEEELGLESQVLPEQKPYFGNNLSPSEGSGQLIKMTNSEEVQELTQVVSYIEEGGVEENNNVEVEREEESLVNSEKFVEEIEEGQIEVFIQYAT